MKTRLEERMENSLILLDTCKKDWRNYIVLDKLNMEDSTQCVFGQVFGDYFYALEKLGITYQQSCFSFAFNDAKGEYEELTKVWKKIISELQREKEKC